MKRTSNNIRIKKSSNKNNKRVRCMDNVPDLFSISKNLSNNTESIGKIMDNYDDNSPGYLEQFEEQRFDSSGPKYNNSSVNDDYSELGNNNTYGITSEKDFTHTNMVPFFKNSGGYGSNDKHISKNSRYKNDLFTGNLKGIKMEKKVVDSMFDPRISKDDVYVKNGLENFDRKRFEASRYHQGHVPFESERVTPGMGIGYHGTATHGLHPENRVMPKTIDEMLLNPKQSYEGRVIEGQHGTKRPAKPNVTNYKVPRFSENNLNNMVPTFSGQTGPKSTENIILKETNKPDAHVEYTGAPFESSTALNKNVPEYMKEKYRESEKIEYSMPDPMHKFSSSQSTYLRKDKNDIPDATLKELYAENPAYRPAFGSSTLRGIVHSVDVADKTIKETTIDNRLNPHVTGLSYLPRVYNTDQARTTIRETSDLSVNPMNIGTSSSSTYANITDHMKPTIRETLDNPNYFGQIANQNNIYVGAVDQFRNTLKEQFTQMDLSSVNISPNNQMGFVNSMSAPIATMKESNLHSTRGGLTDHISAQTAKPSDQFRTTLKDQQSQKTFQMIMNPVSHKNLYVAPTDTFRTSNKESNLRESKNPNINLSNTGHKININYPTKTTNKEISIDYNKMMQADSLGTNNYRIHLSDPLSTTISETNMYSRQPNMDVYVENRKIGISDNLRTTGKEQFVDFNHSGQIQLGSTGDKSRIDDVLSTTNKEQVDVSNRMGQMQLGKTGYKSRVDDNLRTTGRELSEISNRMNHIQLDSSGNKSRINDNLRATNKEQLSVNNRAGQMQTGSDGNKSRISDNFRTTMREANIENNRNRNIETSSLLSKRTVGPTDRLRTTIKEQNIGEDGNYRKIIQDMTKPNHRLHLRDSARTTRKEQLIDNPRTDTISKINFKNQRRNNEPTKTTRKETLIDNRRSNQLHNHQKSGKVYSDSTRKTLRETSLHIPYLSNIDNGQGQSHVHTSNMIAPDSTNKEMSINNQRISQMHRNSAPILTSNDPSNTTVKEQSVVNSYTGNMTGHAGIRNNSQDVSKTTNKEMSNYEALFNHSLPGTGIKISNNDPLKTTNKEQSIHIPYASQISQLTGPKTSLSDVARTSNKEMAVTNNRMNGGVRQTDNDGYGYLTVNHELDVTNRELNLENSYIGQVVGREKDRSKQDIKNMRTDDTLEKSQIYRIPTKSNVNLGKTKPANVRRKSDDNLSRKPNPGQTDNTKLKRLVPEFNLRNDSRETDNSINNIIMSQLDSNPFHIKS